MTQTIAEMQGRFIVWITADYGQGRRGTPKKAEITRYTLAEYVRLRLADGNLADLSDEVAEECVKTLLTFGKGYAYEVATDGDGSEDAFFPSYAAARDYALSLKC